MWPALIKRALMKRIAENIAKETIKTPAEINHPRVVQARLETDRLVDTAINT